MWKYDDSNETDLPIAVTDLVSGQRTYALPSEALTIQRIDIQDNNDIWFQIQQLIPEDIKGEEIDEFMKVDSTPIYYRTIGNTIQLFPGSDYNKTGCAKVYFDRAGVDFAYNDTTKTPGFASPYHDLIAVGASLEWLKAKRPDTNTISLLRDDWMNGQKEVQAFYSLRNKNLSVLRRSMQTFG